MFKIIIHNSIRIYYTTKTYIVSKLKSIWSKDDTSDYNVIKYNPEEDCMSYGLYTDSRNRSPLDLIEEQPLEINTEEDTEETTKEDIEKNDDNKDTDTSIIEQNQWDII